MHSVLLPAHNATFLSALTYQGIRKALSEEVGAKRENLLRQIHRSANGAISIKEEQVVIFPCRLQ